MEIWKDIIGYEGLYQVSDIGNVRSLNWRNTQQVKNLYLKSHNKGYKQVELCNHGNRKMFTVHRLVATAFLPNPLNKSVVNHINEDKTDNRVCNLEWCDFDWNVRYSIPHRAARKVSVRLQQKIQQLDQNGKVIKCWENATEIKHSLGYNDWSIKQCCQGKRKNAYGYKWRFAI